MEGLFPGHFEDAGLGILARWREVTRTERDGIQCRSRWPRYVIAGHKRPKAQALVLAVEKLTRFGLPGSRITFFRDLSRSFWGKKRDKCPAHINKFFEEKKWKKKGNDGCIYKFVLETKRVLLVQNLWDPLAFCVTWAVSFSLKTTHVKTFYICTHTAFDIDMKSRTLLKLKWRNFAIKLIIVFVFLSVLWSCGNCL